jgi:DNA-binding winged helix-turn-helix (wHTH) protein
MRNKYSEIKSACRQAEGTLVEFRVLGPVELWIGERQWELGGPKEQSALAILAMSAGRTVSAATLGERIWGDEWTNRARETLHALISRLRKRLRNAGLVSPMILTSSAQGYRLDVPAASNCSSSAPPRPPTRIRGRPWSCCGRRRRCFAASRFPAFPATGRTRPAPACSNGSAPRYSAGSASNYASAATIK